MVASLIRPETPVNRPVEDDISNVPSRTRSRVEYKRTQLKWAKHQIRSVQSILDVLNHSVRAVLETPSNETPDVDHGHSKQLNSVWQPITYEEIKASFPAKSSAPCPDVITPRDLSSYQLHTLSLFYNLILHCGEVPTPIRGAMTIFIPKTTHATDPGEFRPITTSSVIVRHVHAVLSAGLGKAISLDLRQRAFTNTDGCADNTTLLDLILRSQHDAYTSCYIAVIAKLLTPCRKWRC